MAAIITAHMMNTTSQLVIDHAVVGIMSCATGLSIVVAPLSRRSQPPSAGAQMPTAVHGHVRVSSRKNVVKVVSALVGERSKETVSASDFASHPVIIELHVGGTGSGDRLARRYGKRMPLNLRRSTALPLNRLYLD